MNEHRIAIESILSPNIDIDSMEYWIKELYMGDRAHLYDFFISETEQWIIDTCKAYDKTVDDSVIYLIDQTNVAESDYAQKQLNRTALIIAHRNLIKNREDLVLQLNNNAKQYNPTNHE